MDARQTNPPMPISLQASTAPGDQKSHQKEAFSSSVPALEDELAATLMVVAQLRQLHREAITRAARICRALTDPGRPGMEV